MWRTEVNIGARTWAISTARVDPDSSTDEGMFETTITAPGTPEEKSVRHSSTLEEARRAHELLLAEYAKRPGAVVVECLSRPWRF